MPDIDVDFAYERSQEVIDYVGEKIRRRSGGPDRHVRYPGGPRRDPRCGARHGSAYSLCDQVAKMVPTELNITLNKALEMNPEFRKLYQEDEQVHHLIDMCKRLEGLPRHTSMHAAGVVISRTSIDEFVPLSRGSDIPS